MKFQARNHKWQKFLSVWWLGLAALQYRDHVSGRIVFAWIFLSVINALQSLMPAVLIEGDRLLYRQFFTQQSISLSEITAIKLAPVDKVSNIRLELASGKKLDFNPEQRETFIELATKANPKIIVHRFSPITITALPPQPPSKPSTWLIRPTTPWNPIAWLSLVYDSNTHTIHPISSSPNRPEVNVADRIKTA